MSDAERLKSLAMSSDRDGLEEAWLEELENPGSPEAFLDALDALPEDTRAEASQALLPLAQRIASPQIHRDPVAVDADAAHPAEAHEVAIGVGILYCAEQRAHVLFR